MYQTGRRKGARGQSVQQQDNHHDRRANVFYQSLRDWVDEIVEQNQNPAWEEDVLREMRSALDNLAELSMKQVDKSIIDRFLDDMRDEAQFLRREYYLGHKDDHPPWSYSNDSTSVDMQNFAIMAKSFAKSPHPEQPWRQIDELFRLLFYLEKLQRFLDKKNPQIEDSPPTNGSTLADPDLRAAFSLNQFWMSLLHDRSLFHKGLETGLLQLGKILIITRVQQEQEASRTRDSESQVLASFRDSKRQLIAGFRDIQSMISTTRVLLRSLAEQFGDYCRLPGSLSQRFKKPISLRETDYRIDSREVEMAWTTATEQIASETLHTIELWSKLLDLAEIHNDELDQRYVEDILWSKNVPDKAEPLATELALKISQVNRERRNYLLLCDWSKRRPWKQIYYIFDTAAFEILRDPIDYFHDRLETFLDSDFKQVQKNSPCHPGNILQGIFPIHPIPNHRPFIGHGSYTDSCVICGEKYEVADKIARLHCDHYFHFSCVRKHWDKARNHNYTCPSCKKKSAPRLNKAPEIDEELRNLAADAKRALETAPKRASAKTSPQNQSVDHSKDMAQPKVLRDAEFQAKVKDSQPAGNQARKEEKAASRRSRQESSSVDKRVDKDGAKKVTDETRNDSVVEKAPTNKRARSEDEVLSEAKKPKVDLSLNPPPMERLDVYVCGSGESGELGLGAKPFDGKKPLGVKRPRYNHLLKEVTQIGVGGMHCIALTDDHKVLTWGVNDDGALARNTAWESAPTKDADADSDSEEEDTPLNPSESTPSAISTSFLGTKRAAQVVASDSASFVLTDDGMVYGWGTFRGNEGLIGFTSEGAAKATGIKDDASKKKHQIQLEPILIPGLHNIKSLARGGNHVLALDNKGNVFSWGSWQQCQIGRRTSVRTAFSGLIPAPFMKKIKYIAAGAYHSFAIDTRDRVWAWGLNNFGQTGIASNAGEDGAIINAPTQVKSLSNYKIKQIKGGVHHTIACTEDGQVLVWGRCDDDQAGIDLTTLPLDDMIFSHAKPRILTKPTVVPGISATFVAAGIDNCMVVSKEGRVYAWGFSASYRTGLGTDDNVTRPTLVENTAVKGKKMTFVGCGGQFGVLAGPENR